MIKISTKVNPEFVLFFKAHERLAMVFGCNIHIYHSKTGDLIKILFQHEGNIKAINENGQNLMSLDEKGLLCLWNSDTLDLIVSKNFPERVLRATIASNLEFLYYTREKEKVILRVSTYNFNNEWEYFEENLQRPKSLNTRKYRLRISQNDNFLIEYGEKNVFVYSTQNQNFLNRIKHNTDITSLEIHPLNDAIIVGDRVGKITYYYGAFVPGVS